MGIVTGYLSQLVNNGIKLLNGGTAVSSSNPLPVGDSALLAKFSATANSDAGRLPVSEKDGELFSGSATSAATLYSASVIGFSSVSLQVTSAGTGCTITYEFSDDNTYWIACAGMSKASTGNTLPSSTSTTTIGLNFTRRGTYFRARVSTYGSGTVSIVGSLSKVPAIYTIATATQGVTTENQGTSGINPLLIGLEARTVTKTLASSGALVKPISTTDGRQITRANSIPENEWQYAAASGGITNTTDVVLQGAAGSGVKNYLTGLDFANASATATEIVIKDGSTVIWRTNIPANTPLQNRPFPTPLQSTANTALNAACITTGTQTYINAQGYKAP